MKLINSSVEVIEPTGYTLQDIYKQIELAGRTCYKSEDKMTDTSAKDFVNRMVASKHYAMLEHGTVYLKFTDNAVRTMIIDHIKCDEYLYDDYTYNKYSDINSRSNVGNTDWYVTTNYRVLVENNWLDDLQYLCEPTEYHEKRTTVRFICDRGVSHELVRHRVFSFAQETTRYCNYSKDKFGKELTFIKPSWWKEEDNEVATLYIQPWRNIENCYLTLIENGIKPQDARAILPNALKTEVVMTGFESDWDHFFELRCAKAAHPDMQKLANELKGKFHEKEVDNKDK